MTGVWSHMLWLLGLFSCAGAAPVKGAGTDPSDTADTADTAGTDAIDADGDGYPSWTTTLDPERADCDDADAAITPATERFVAAGTFTRGDAFMPWSNPARVLTIKDVCVDRFEVTNADFLELLIEREADGLSNVDDAGRMLFDVLDHDDVYPERILVSDGNWSIEAGYEDHPVVEVWTWSAELFCDWRHKRLPTEAEWEKAARGPDDTRAFPWGDEAPDCERAEIALLVDGKPAPCTDDTAPVGSFPDGASPYGILDMTGNVEEWASDWFAPDYWADAPDVDPQGPAEGALFNDGAGEFVARVGRGGNYLLAFETLKLTARIPEPEDATSNGVGFRCARELP